MREKVEQFCSHKWACRFMSQMKFVDLLIDLHGTLGCSGLRNGESVPPLPLDRGNYHTFTALALPKSSLFDFLK